MHPRAPALLLALILPACDEAAAVLPDAPTAPAFWQNIVNKHYSIIETPADRWGIADYYDPDPAAS